MKLKHQVAMMGSSSKEKELSALERALVELSSDFISAYMAVRELHSFIRSHPELIGIHTVSALRQALESRCHLSQKQALFFYKEAADALLFIATQPKEEETIASSAIMALRDVAGTLSGLRKRAAAEAIGSLPVRVCGPVVDALPAASAADLPTIRWEEALELAGAPIQGNALPIGRSLVAPLEDANLLVLKLAGTIGTVDALRKEAAWMEHLRSQGLCFPVPFEIPKPLRVNGGHAFRLQSLPESVNGSMRIHPERCAIAFIAHEDYFTYINGRAAETGLDFDSFKDVLCGDAWLMGKLAAMGIVHLAPIPLFHNRVQRERRPDRGIYEWPRGGRLDRWLHSCCYPNFGLTGLRDFEHFISLGESGGKLYQHIGSHILSLILVGASYFRNQDPSRQGFDCNGMPVDARELFDRAALRALLEGVLAAYYDGFVGGERLGGLSVDLDELAARMIEEMGVDRHMEEILRVADQSRMSDSELKAFMKERGFADEMIESIRRGVSDIVIHTGPHLGAFNNRISLPEITELLATASAVCIAGKWMSTDKRDWSEP